MRSVWQRDCSLPEHPPPAGEIRTGVLVIGGGLAGLLTAWTLRQHVVAGENCGNLRTGITRMQSKQRTGPLRTP